MCNIIKLHGVPTERRGLSTCSAISHRRMSISVHTQESAHPSRGMVSGQIKNRMPSGTCSATVTIPGNLSCDLLFSSGVQALPGRDMLASGLRSVLTQKLGRYRSTFMSA